MHQKLKKCLVIALIISVILSFFYLINLFSNLQVSVSDGFYGGIQPREDIKIIAIDDKSLQEIGRWPWDRKEFADIILLLNKTSVTAIDVAFFETSDTINDNALINSVEKAGNVIIPVEYTSYAVQNKKVIGKEILLPIEGLGDAADGLGYINIVTDRDGVTRAANLDVEGDYDSFARIAYEKHTKTKFPYKTQRFLINFIGKPKSFPTYSFTDILNKRVNTSIFKDKIVFIGATAPDLHDDYFVPTSKGKAMPGVEIHANTLQTMLDKNFLIYENKLIVILSIFLASLITVLLLYKLHAWTATAIIAGLIIAYIFAAILIFNNGIIMNLIYIPLAFILTQGSSIIYFYITEKKEKKHIVKAFGKYVSPVIVKQLRESPEKLKLGGEKRTITIFFSDIRGFTALSEKIKPEELVHHLNEYMTEMTKIIIKKQGLVDKFIGDAIMAFWGAPLDQEDHAKLACEASLEMMEKLKELQKQWKKQGKPIIKIGIGINSGEAIIGNMGSEDRFDYTAIGDTINLGSRLEGLTKEYKADIIISQATKKLVEDEFVTEKLGTTIVKGKKKSVKIYELVSRKSS